MIDQVLRAYTISHAVRSGCTFFTVDQNAVEMADDYVIEVFQQGRTYTFKVIPKPKPVYYVSVNMGIYKEIEGIFYVYDNDQWLLCPKPDKLAVVPCEFIYETVKHMHSENHGPYKLFSSFNGEREHYECEYTDVTDAREERNRRNKNQTIYGNTIIRNGDGNAID